MTKFTWSDGSNAVVSLDLKPWDMYTLYLNFQQVTRAVTSIQDAHRQLQNGKLREAFSSARQAILASEKAFFDPSLLELLYFPEDQKFAIYIPLFLPISIPVVLSLMQAIKWIRNKDKVKTE